jgi:hypothetical protein
MREKPIRLYDNYLKRRMQSRLTTAREWIPTGVKSREETVRNIIKKLESGEFREYDAWVYYAKIWHIPKYRSSSFDHPWWAFGDKLADGAPQFLVGPHYGEQEFHHDHTPVREYRWILEDRRTGLFQIFEPGQMVELIERVAFWPAGVPRRQ